MEELNKLINSNLNIILIRCRTNRADLAKKIGISQSALSQRLAGNITLDTIAKICTALNIKPHELFRELKLK